MNEFLAHITKIGPAYEAVIGLFLVALVTTMPVPGSPLTWGTIYRWIYDALQGFVGALRPRPTPPGERPADQPKQ